MTPYLVPIKHYTLLDVTRQGGRQYALAQDLDSF